MLIAPVTSEEVKTALWSIDPRSAHGPDGFSANFYRHAWGIVGGEVTFAVQEFFLNSQMLRQINTTTFVLIPKKDNPESIRDYRPLSCCNVLLKIITKILATRLRRVLPRIVSEVQGAFVENRLMQQNIFLCQELLHNFGRKGVAS